MSCLGFHSLTAAATVSKTLSHAPDAATRARHRLTLDAIPDLPLGTRNIYDRSCASEYLSLAPRLDGPAGPRKLVCDRLDIDSKTLKSVFRTRHTRCVLRTVCQQDCIFPFIVEINKCRGEVLVYEHPSADANGEKLPFGSPNGTQEFQWVMDRCSLDEMRVLECYEAAGVFFGTSCLSRESSIERPEFGGSILVQLSATNHIDPRYPYVFIGDCCRYFETTEPITRYFHNVCDKGISNIVALTSTYALFPSRGGFWIPKIAYAPRTAFFDYYGESYASMEERAGEGVWELCQANCHERLPRPHPSFPATIHRFSPSYYMHHDIFFWQRRLAEKDGLEDHLYLFPLDEVREYLDWHWAGKCADEKSPAFGRW